jgi:hypothetical protein
MSDLTITATGSLSSSTAATAAATNVAPASSTASDASIVGTATVSNIAKPSTDQKRQAHLDQFNRNALLWVCVQTTQNGPEYRQRK